MATPVEATEPGTPQEAPISHFAQEERLQVHIEDEKILADPIGKARGILICTLVVLTQLVQVSRFRLLSAVCTQFFQICTPKC
jgi:hypothetical protein